MMSLQKLKTTKTADRKKTLLHVIIEVIEKEAPEILQFPDLLVNLKESNDGMSLVQEYSASCRKFLTVGLKAAEQLQLSEIQKQMTQYQEDVNKTEQVLQSITHSMEYLGYSSAQTTPADFFAFWVDFVETFRLSKKWLEDNDFIAKHKKRRDAQRMRDQLIQDLVKSANDHPILDSDHWEEEPLRISIANLRESPDFHVSLRTSSAQALHVNPDD